MRQRSFFVTASVLLGAFSSSAAFAQGASPSPPPTSPDTPVHKLSVTVSGGISLGSYQAGATWALIYVLRNHDALTRAMEAVDFGPNDRPARPPRYDLDVVTGASAGNVNAILAAVEYCAATPSQRPEISSFWNAWVPIGHKELMAENSVDSENRAVFSRKSFDTIWNNLEKTLAHEGSGSRCDMMLGITATRLSPRNVHVANGVDLPVQRFAGVFRLVAADSALVFEMPRQQVVGPDLTDILILDPEMEDTIRRIPRRLPTGDVPIPLKSVRALVEASSSFPVAFAPRQVPYRFLDELDWKRDSLRRPPCLLKATPGPECELPRTDRFVDGGVFDNRPLELAMGLSRAVHGLRERVWRDSVERTTVLGAVDSALTSSACQQTPNASIGGRALLTDSIRSLGRLLLAMDSVELHARSADSSLADSVLSRHAARAGIGAELTRRLAELDSLAQRSDQKSILTRECALGLAKISKIRDSIYATRRALPPRLLYFIDDDARRGQLEDTLSSDASDASGGIAAGWQLLSRAFTTGQNYEMRAFANDIANEQQKADGFALGVNSRYPRLMGEHINHFGAFFSKVFREHDFYAGVYDGLRSAFRELYCRTPTLSSGGHPTPIQAADCEALWMRVVLHQNLLSIQPEGKAELERLFAIEQHQLPPNAPMPSDHKSQILVALVDANAAMRPLDFTRCHSVGIIEKPLCSEALLVVLNGWRERLDRSSVGWKSLLCTDSAADRDACDLVGDPRSFYHGLVLNALTRMRLAEALLDKDREPGSPGAVGIPLYFERAYYEQFRAGCGNRSHYFSCFDFNPTTADVLGGDLFKIGSRFIPQSFTVYRNGGARWLQWRPTLYLARKAEFAFAAITPLELVRSEGRQGFDAGAGFLVIPPWPVSSFSLSQIWRAERRPKTDLTVSLFAGIVRVGIRGAAMNFSEFFAGKNVTFGIGDTNGLTARFLVWARHGFRR